MKRIFLIAALLPPLAILGLQLLVDSFRKKRRATASKNAQQERDAATLLREEGVFPDKRVEVLEGDFVELGEEGVGFSGEGSGFLEEGVEKGGNGGPLENI